MVSPLIDRRSCAPVGLLAAHAEASPELLSVEVRRAVPEIVGRDHPVELSERIAAWFDRRL